MKTEKCICVRLMGHCFNCSLSVLRIFFLLFSVVVFSFGSCTEEECDPVGTVVIHDSVFVTHQDTFNCHLILDTMIVTGQSAGDGISYKIVNHLVGGALPPSQPVEYNIDFDNDGYNDLVVSQYLFSYPGSSGSAVSLRPVGSARILRSVNFAQNYLDTMSQGKAVAYVSSNGAWTNQTCIARSYANTMSGFVESGLWTGTWYTGVSFVSGMSRRYAWVKMDISSGNSAFVTSYAYTIPYCE